MENFLNRLARNPYAPIDGASVTRVDELGNGYDDWNQLIAPKFEQPQQTWGETALGVATAPARIATALAGSLSPYGQDGWQVPPIVSEGVDALTAVGDAYTGKMAPEDVNSRALGMAGFMMGGGGLAARPVVAAERAAAQAIPNRPFGMFASEFEKGGNAYVANGYVKDGTAHVGWIGPKGVDPESPNALARSNANQLSRRDLREWRDDFIAKNPDVTQFEGLRVSGAKAGTGERTQTIDALFSNASKEGAIPALLDMGQEARLARARDMGFDTDTTWYHGTFNDFDEFDPSTIGDNFRADDRGFFFSNVPSIGSGYAVSDSVGLPKDGGMVLPTRLKMERPLIIDEMFLRKEGMSGALAKEDPIGFWDNYQSLIHDWVDADKADGVVIVDPSYRVPEGPNKGQPSMMAAAFDPTRIRSVNAAFDPSKADSANLLAANADSRPALLGAGQEQDIPDWLLPYLGR